MNKADGERNLSKLLAIVAVAASIMMLLSIGKDIRFPVLICWAASWALMYEACCMYESAANSHIHFCAEKDREIAELKKALYQAQSASRSKQN